AHWVTIGNRLADGDDIGHDALLLECPEIIAGPAKADLYFVGQTQPPGSMHGGMSFAQIPRRQHDLPTAAKHGFTIEHGRIDPTFTQTSDFLHKVGSILVARAFDVAVRATVGIGHRYDTHMRYLAGTTSAVELVRT